MLPGRQWLRHPSSTPTLSVGGESPSEKQRDGATKRALAAAKRQSPHQRCQLEIPSFLCHNHSSKQSTQAPMRARAGTGKKLRARSRIFQTLRLCLLWHNLHRRCRVKAAQQFLLLLLLLLLHPLSLHPVLCLFKTAWSLLPTSSESVFMRHQMMRGMCCPRPSGRLAFLKQKAA